RQTRVTAVTSGASGAGLRSLLRLRSSSRAQRGTLRPHRSSSAQPSAAQPSSAPASPRSAALPVLPWRGLEGSDRLEAWRANVGAPVALDLAPVGVPGAVTSLAVLSWNLWIGRGRLEEVVARVRDTTDAPLLVLAQEAYRADASVSA